MPRNKQKLKTKSDKQTSKLTDKQTPKTQTSKPPPTTFTITHRVLEVEARRPQPKPRDVGAQNARPRRRDVPDDLLQVGRERGGQERPCRVRVQLDPSSSDGGGGRCQQPVRSVGTTKNSESRAESRQEQPGELSQKRDAVVFSFDRNRRSTGSGEQKSVEYIFRQDSNNAHPHPYVLLHIRMRICHINLHIISFGPPLSLVFCYLLSI